MTTEQLLQMRYIVIADYPAPEVFPIGTILTNCEPDKWTDFKEFEFSELNSWFQKYPAIFRELKWWEQRKNSDLPEYVIWDKIGSVYKATWKGTDNMLYMNGKYYGNPAHLILPATLEQYNAYLKMK